MLLSGGLDSTTVLADAKAKGFVCVALTIDYQQSHSIELESAKKIAKHFNVEEHLILKLNLSLFGGSVLTGDENAFTLYKESKIPPTYVPARNALFLTLAFGLAEARQATHVFIGVSSVDYSGYPDCRAEFISAMQNALNLGTREGVLGNGFQIETPLINLSKSETISLGKRLGVDYGMTHSCYHPNNEGIACGVCDSCKLRLKGFAEAGVRDPLKYQNNL